MTTPSQRRLRIHFLQAGYSDCIIIECKMWEGAHDSELFEPHPHECLHYASMIIDGGMARGALNQNVSSYCKDQLHWKPDRRFDYQLLTHFHEDHVNGLVTQQIRSKVIIDPGLGAATTLRSERVQPKFSVPLKGGSIDAYQNACRKQVKRDGAIWTIPPFACIGEVKPSAYNTPQLDQPDGKDIKFHWLFGGGVLAPLDGDETQGKPIFGDTTPGGTISCDNASPNLVSLGFVIEWGEFLFYSAGDAFATELENPAFEALLGAGSGKDGKSAPPWMRSGDTLKRFSVVKSSHHGSSTSVGQSKTGSGDELRYWLEKINPDTVVMLSNFKHSNLPSVDYATALLATAKKRRDEKVDFGVYFWNDFSVICGTSKLRASTVNKLENMLNLNAASGASGPRLLSNIAFNKDGGYVYCTNRSPYSGDASLSADSIKKHKLSGSIDVPSAKKRKNDRGSTSAENSDFSSYSPLALVIEVSDATLIPEERAATVTETTSGSPVNMMERRARRRLHVEKQILRALTEQDLGGVGVGAGCPRLKITIKFNRVLPDARSGLRDLLTCNDIYVAKNQDKFAHFFPEKGKVRDGVRQMLRDPFRRLYCIANALSISASVDTDRSQAASDSLECLLDSVGSTAEMAFNSVLFNKKKADEGEVRHGSAYSEKELDGIMPISVFKLRDPDQAWDPYEVETIADQVADAFICAVWEDSGMPRTSFKDVYYPHSIEHTMAQHFLTELYTHPLLGIVALQLLGSTTSVRAAKDRPLRIENDDRLDSALAANKALFEDLGLSKAEFDPDLFYPIAREGTP